MIRDLWRMRDYVDEANEAPLFMDIQSKQREHLPQPPANAARFAGQYLAGSYFSILLSHCYDPMPVWHSQVLLCFGFSLGVFLVGTAGASRTGNYPMLFLFTLAGSALGTLQNYATSTMLDPFRWEAQQNVNFFAILFCFYRHNKTIAWAPSPRPRQPRLLVRLLRFAVSAFIALAVISSSIGVNLRFSLSDDATDSKPLKDHLRDLFESKDFQQFRNFRWEYAYRAYESVRDQVKDKMYAVDMAYTTLGVSKSASEKEVHRAYKKLALQYHPDKQPPEKREEMNAKFVELTNAYELLRKRYADRKDGGSAFTATTAATGSSAKGSRARGPASSRGADTYDYDEL